MHQVVLYPPNQPWVRRDAGAPRQAVPLPSTPPTRRPCLSGRRSGVLFSAAPGPNPTGPSSSSQPDAAQKRAEITANVERAAAMVGEIVNEVTRELFVSEAVAYIQNDRADQTELVAVREAVARRLDFLDANFLTTLAGFIRACEQRGDSQLCRMLTAIHEEVLRLGWGKRLT
ncbi:hypothetical protein VOLCADRAFT_108806 [Volvox carteri f. nagariensis]|uniref:Uncharacterized protein n=1 Tax=Volvox carteri f. nagariensis TaxID=3068 RepID=D8UMT2_VOLCA|nr:uncharacterized protein VOLCADRAFT_108806 [Volvox carteri f. nagariensis]EFJ38967.1 hypothetical protein VOLCADRAFT_108806 [Volvox carteri f. nagariensis]|eukprot:XP_002959968.1 hypothetical protein VOLCADRAFT_108806 [Volvox carteri f. nagariensis]